jgi:hypothetical protein
MREGFTTVDMEQPVNTAPPRVAVVLAHHRPETDPLVADAIRSVRGQSYTNKELVLVDCVKAGISSQGKAWNLGVATSEAPLVAFLREYDMLTEDTLQAMVDLYHMVKKEVPGLVHITTQCLALFPNGNKGLSTARAPGLFERSFLMEVPFTTEVMRPEEAMVGQLAERALRTKQDATIGLTHHFGYVLRDVPFRRDGIIVK